jgi:hypothetical protein
MCICNARIAVFLLEDSNELADEEVLGSGVDESSVGNFYWAGQQDGSSGTL